MTKIFDKQGDYIRERDLFLAEVSSPDPDIDVLLDCLSGITVAVLYPLDDDVDDDSAGSCKQTGTVHTIGKSVHVPGTAAPDFVQILAEPTMQDYENLEAGWQLVRPAANTMDWDVGTSMLEDLLEFLEP